METNQHIPRTTLQSQALLLLALVLIAGGLLAVTNRPGGSGDNSPKENAAPIVLAPTDCTVNISNPVPPSLNCTVSNSNPSPNETVTYTATVINGSGSYTYTWVPTVPSLCTGTGNTRSCTFPDPGTNYDMTVTANGTGSPSDTCPITTKSPAAYIYAAPDRVKVGGVSGDKVDVGWSATQVSTCSVTNNGVEIWNSSALVPPLSSTNVNVPASTSTGQTVGTHGSTFKISCDGAAASDVVIVDVGFTAEEF